MDQKNPDENPQLSTRAFPSWLRRIDQTLSGEDTNTIFQAFHQRRITHSTRGFTGIGLFSFSGYIIGLGILAFLVSCVFHFSYYYFSWIGGGLVLLGVVMKVMSYSAVHENQIPLHISAAFTPGSLNRPLALDLWLAGVKGRELFEALYLEKRAAEWGWFWYPQMLLTSIAALSYLFLRGIHGCVELILVASLFYFSLQVSKYIQLLRSREILRSDVVLTSVRMLEPNARVRYVNLGKWLVKHFFLFFLIMIGLVVMAANLYGVIMSFLKELEGYRISIPLILPHVSYFADWIFIIAMALIAVSFQDNLDIMGKTVKRVRDAVMEGGDDTFQYYIRFVVMNDPDEIKPKKIDVEKLIESMKKENTG